MDKDLGRNQTESIQCKPELNRSTRDLQTMVPSKARAVRGFAAMDEALQREISRMGGRAAHESGRAHEWNSAEARVAGRLSRRSRSHD
jgi:hypothetical protein